MKKGSQITSVKRQGKQGNASLPSDRGTAHAQYHDDGCCGSPVPVQPQNGPASLQTTDSVQSNGDCCSQSETVQSKEGCCAKPEPTQLKDDCCSGPAPVQSTDSCCSASMPDQSKGDHCTGSESVHFGDDCCSSKEQELVALAQHDGIKHVLQIVLLINLVMFVSEFTAGVIANSTALMADSIDMLGDASVYIVSLYALSRGPRWKAGAALMKGGIILAFGLWIAVEVVLKMRYGVTPTAGIMGIFGAIALGANITCLLLLWRYRKVDVNMSSTFECSRNDIIANVGVLFAAAGVWWTGAAWPDILIGSIVAALFFRSSIRVIGQAWPQFRSEKLSPR